MRKLNKAIDRFCALHPRFGIPGLMRYIVGANLVIYLLSQFAGAALWISWLWKQLRCFVAKSGAFLPTY